MNLLLLRSVAAAATVRFMLYAAFRQLGKLPEDRVKCGTDRSSNKFAVSCVCVSLHTYTPHTPFERPFTLFRSSPIHPHRHFTPTQSRTKKKGVGEGGRRQHKFVVHGCLALSSVCEGDLFHVTLIQITFKIFLKVFAL